MEFEFGKHFKDATNLLLMMDHDSGYVEGESCTSSSNDSEHIQKNFTRKKESDNFLLSEDALLERPELFFDLATNLPPEIDREDQSRVFLSPEHISSSVISQDSTAEYSGLENESISSSQKSAEIPFIAPIAVAKQDLSKMDDEVDNDILMISATESDMSLEQTFDPVILEKASLACCSDEKVISPFNGFYKQEVSQNNSAIATSNSVECLKSGTEDVLESNEKIEKPYNNQSIQESPKNPNKTPTKPILDEPRPSSKSPNNWSITKSIKPVTPSKANTPLAPLTNTFDFEAPQFIPKDKKRLTLIFSKAEKENRYSVKRKYASLTPEKSIDKSLVDPEISPDIFDSEELEEVQDNKSSYFELPSVVPEEPYGQKLDKKLLKRVQTGMSGVLPPPSVTIIHMSARDILGKLEENKSFCFWNKDENEGKGADGSLNSSGSSGKFSNSLLLSAGLEEVRKSEFPEVSNMRCHGLHYNCGKISEEIVDLCDKYQKRFVGAETQSTCTVFETHNSPTKRRTTKPKWGTKSPGRRLSHLARRRITFSSSNLQAGGGSALAGSRARQILVDAKKIDLLSRRRSPRKTPRKTPNKSPKVKTRTPSSSAKKKLAMRFRKLTGEIEKSAPNTSELSSVPRALFKSPAKSEGRGTKRALFQSPGRDISSSLNVKSKSQNVVPSSTDRGSQLRRALFTSPRKNSPLKSKSPFKRGLIGYEKKRKRSESDEAPPTKFPRSMSMDARPSTSAAASRVISRAQSELNISANNRGQNELSEQHKKKLFWAVSTALQSQNVTSIHPQWKAFASVLARVTRRFYANQMGARSATAESGGTSERMQRIAKYHVISVIKGKSAEEIIGEYLKNRANRVQKPRGYVAPPPQENGGAAVSGKKLAPSGGKENVFQDRANTMESWEKRKFESAKSTLTENKIERIRKVINFGDDR